MFKKRIISLTMALLILVVTSLSATALSVAETNYISAEITQNGEMTIRGNLYGEWLGAEVAVVILKPDAVGMTPQEAMEDPNHKDLVEKVIQTTTDSYGKFSFTHILENIDLFGQYTVTMSYRNTETLKADRTVVCDYYPVVGLFANAHIDTNGYVTVWGNTPRMDVDTVDIIVKRVDVIDDKTTTETTVLTHEKYPVTDEQFMFRRVLYDIEKTGVHKIYVNAGGKEKTIKANYFGAYSTKTALEKTYPDTHPLQLFVSPDANEFGAGSEADPFNSLHNAVKLIENLKLEDDKFNEDINIYLRDGDHYLTSTLELNAANTLSNGRKLTFTSYPGERATIHGGKVITGWKENGDGKYYADVELDDFRELYVNGELATRARTENTYQGIGWYNNSGKYYNDDMHYPEGNTNIGEIAPGALHRHNNPNGSGTANTSPTGFRGGLVIKSEGELNNIAKWDNQEDIEIVSVGAAASDETGTSFVHHRIMSTDIITMKNPSITNANGSTETLSGTIPILLFNSAASFASTENMPNFAWKYQTRFHMENAYELLNEAGEWYYDNDARRLYYIPEDDVDMDTAVIEVPQVEKLITITGTTSEKVSNVIFRDLDIGYATWLGINNIGGYATMQAGNTLTKGMNGHTPGSITLNYTDNVDFIGCTIKNLGAAGIVLEEGAINTDITDNEIKNIGASSVSIGRTHHNYIGDYVVDDKGNLTDEIKDPGEKLCTDTNILRNYIHNIAWQYTSNPGIWALYTQKLNVSNNKIHNTAYTGISVGWGWHSYRDSDTCHTNTISYNYIYDVMLNQGYDGAPIYTLGHQPRTVIHNNYLYINNALGHGIYLDEGSNYIHAYENVIHITDKALTEAANVCSTDWLRVTYLKNGDGNVVAQECQVYDNYTTTSEEDVVDGVDTELNWASYLKTHNTFGKDILELEEVKTIIANSGIHGVYLGGGAVMDGFAPDNSTFLTTDGNSNTKAYIKIKNYDATDIETDVRLVVYEGKRMREHTLIKAETFKGGYNDWYTIDVDTSFYNSNTIKGAPRYKVFFWEKLVEDNYLPLLKSVELYN